MCKVECVSLISPSKQKSSKHDVRLSSVFEVNMYGFCRTLKKQKTNLHLS